MKVNLRNMSNIDLAKIFDFMSKTGNESSAEIIINRLAKRYHKTFEDELRYLGKRAVKHKNYSSFNMVAKLWKERRAKSTN